jgi:hypothetical protein
MAKYFGVNYDGQFRRENHDSNAVRRNQNVPRPGFPNAVPGRLGTTNSLRQRQLTLSMHPEVPFGTASRQHPPHLGRQQLLHATVS